MGAMRAEAQRSSYAANESHRERAAFAIIKSLDSFCTS